MASAAYGPQDAGGMSEPAAAKAPLSTAGTADAHLLEQVLLRMRDLCGGGEPLEEKEMECLREVARRYRGLPLTREPVAVELVLAVVGVFDRVVKYDRDDWRRIAEQVAQTLLEDPPTAERLNRFWARLEGEAS
jgi:hypothetical protein